MESLTANGLLLLLVLLQVKHALCDGPLQTRWMLVEKGHYGRPGGLVHAGLQGLGSGVCVLAVGGSAGVALLVALADAVAHYHVDFAKQRLVAHRCWSFTDNAYWWAMTADQMLHQLTYIAIAAAMLNWPA